MPNSDFGLVRDPIQSVTQVSPTVAGGQTTYRMTFFSGKTFDFNVYNGQDGSLSRYAMTDFVNCTYTSNTRSAGLQAFRDLLISSKANEIVRVLISSDGNTWREVHIEQTSVGVSPMTYVFIWDGSINGDNRGSVEVLSDSMFASGANYYNATIRVFSTSSESAVYNYDFTSDLQLELGSVYTEGKISAYVSGKSVFINVSVSCNSGTPSTGADTYTVNCDDLLAELDARGLIIPDNGRISAVLQPNDHYFPIYDLRLHKTSGGLEFMFDITNQDASAVYSTTKTFSCVINVII